MKNNCFLVDVPFKSDFGADWVPEVRHLTDEDFTVAVVNAGAKMDVLMAWQKWIKW